MSKCLGFRQALKHSVLPKEDLMGTPVRAGKSFQVSVVTMVVSACCNRNILPTENRMRIAPTH